MAPKKITLTYFNGRGRAEALRWILAQGCCKYEDKRIEQSEWPALKPKTPTGELPCLCVDGCELAQSGAIAQFIANECGLNGKDCWEAARVHMFWDCAYDLSSAKYKIMFCKDSTEQAELKKTFCEKTLPNYLNFLKCHLKGCKWLVGDKLSAADIVSACTLCELDEECQKKIKECPEVCDLVKRVTDQPNIKKWIECRPKTEF